MVNQPYKKVHIDGVQINPITKGRPYSNTGLNRKSRRKLIKTLKKK